LIALVCDTYSHQPRFLTYDIPPMIYYMLPRFLPAAFPPTEAAFDSAIVP